MTDKAAYTITEFAKSVSLSVDQVRKHIDGDVLPQLKMPVVLTESLGSDQMVHFKVDAPVAKVADQDSLDEIVVGGGSGVCIGRFSARSAVRAGETIDIAVDCARLHFFDAASGLAI